VSLLLLQTVSMHMYNTSVMYKPIDENTSQETKC